MRISNTTFSKMYLPTLSQYTEYVWETGCNSRDTGQMKKLCMVEMTYSSSSFNQAIQTFAASSIE